MDHPTGVTATIQSDRSPSQVRMILLCLYAEALNDGRPAIVWCMERMKAPGHHHQHRTDARSQVEMRYLATCFYYPVCMCVCVYV